MITLIVKLFGSTAGKWIAEAVMILSLATGAYLYIEHLGADKELVRLQASSVKLITKANTQIKAEVAAHAADVKANQEKTDAALAANTALQSQLSDSVRNFDAYRHAHPDVPRPTGGPGPAIAGECGAQSCGDLASELGRAGNELALSAANLSAVLQSCQRDRDALTGLPR